MHFQSASKLQIIGVGTVRKKGRIEGVELKRHALVKRTRGHDKCGAIGTVYCSAARADRNSAIRGNKLAAGEGGDVPMRIGDRDLQDVIDRRQKLSIQ